MQIDSFMELPKDKRPPKNIWSKPEELEDWFDRVFEHHSTGVTLTLDEVEE